MTPPESFTPSAALEWLFLLAALAWAAREMFRPGSCRPAWWWLLLLGVLLAFRWPVLWLPHELYPDEGQMLAAALTLRFDPLYWRAVDVGTAGPLDSYALLPAAFFPGMTAYAAARITGTLLVWGTLAFAGEALVLATRSPRARLAALPALLFCAFTTSPECLHYSTELAPGFLLAGAVFFLARQLAQPIRANLWAAGLLLGAVPWAKLQAGPLAAAIGLALVALEWQTGRRQNLPLLVIAGLAPTLLVFLVLTVSGQTEHMITPYLVQNLFYTGTGRQPLGLVTRQQWDQAVTNGYQALWLGGSAAFNLLALVRRDVGTDKKLLAGGAGLLALTVLCILAPGRPYAHYLNLLLLPVTLLLGLALAAWFSVPQNTDARAFRWQLLLPFALLVGPLLVLRLSPRTDPYLYYNTVASAPRSGNAALVARIRAFTSPGEALGLWGWRSSLYLETGLRQATREGTSLCQIITGPAQIYYLHRYFESLNANPPPVFVDAAGPGNYYFDRRSLGHEVFPRLRDWIAANYTLVADLDGTRLYVRNDRVKPGGSS